MLIPPNILVRMAKAQTQSNPVLQNILLGSPDKFLERFDLIETQKKSWEQFIEGQLRTILQEFFPIEDYTGKKFTLTFEDVYFGQPRHPLELCIQKKITYDVPVYVRLKLLNKKTGVEKSQDVYFFNLPKMTERGTFFINGIERCVINQIVRAPGVYFTAEVNQATGQTIYNAEIRPYIGAWIDIAINKNNIIEMKINKKRKFYATTLLKVFEGEDNAQILNYFSDLDKEIREKYIENTLKKDTVHNKNEAVLEIYKKVKPGEPLVLDNAYETVNNLFFNPKRYSLTQVGRYKINKKLGLNIPEDKKENMLLTKNDIIEILKYLVNLTVGKGSFDDIDHLGNRRLRTVGELVGLYGIRVGMVRVEREVKERMSLVQNDGVVTPSQVVNAKPLSVAINTFFRTSQLSTIVDQTNPLSELDNLRRITVGGPGGIEKDRASFSIRDIAASQYSRICPIRSPEGPNIGVVTYLANYAKVNKYGFIEAPYHPVKNGKVLDEVVYMQADDEMDFYIASADQLEFDDKGLIKNKTLVARYKGDLVEVPLKTVQYVDISPRQAVGIAAAVIPFLQNDDASRALMGTHMQCQAVPLVRPSAPVVRTGLESKIATEMGRTIAAPEDGVVEYVDSTKVILKGKSGKTYEYSLERFIRTNKDVIYDQRPAVSPREEVKTGQVIVDGPSTDHGVMALGQNLTVAYTSLNGLGYEDGFVISDRLIKDDVLTSISAQEFIADVVDTKLGPEELTRDIPNVREEILANLDKDGTVTIGTEVKAGDILVGKVAPKGEKELTAEERLLRAIFGEKAKDVKDTSLRMPYGRRGVVTDVEIIDAKKDPNELEPSILQRVLVTVSQLRKVMVGDKLAGRHGNKGVIAKILPACDMPYLADGTPVDVVLSPLSILARMNMGQIYETILGYIGSKKNVGLTVPVFEKIQEDFIQNSLKELGLPVDGRSKLYDAFTGQPYEKPVLIGTGYIMKLIHMVEDKFHARSIGPYSLVSQQPLGGKSQGGGMRFGEMEVWALEAHRVPYTLQELLTIKSDDVRGRQKAFESIIKNVDIPQSSVPESFNVLIKELNALGLSIEYLP